MPTTTRVRAVRERVTAPRCVANVLEVARALRAGPRLRNDVIFVFSDGEENGDLARPPSPGRAR